MIAPSASYSSWETLPSMGLSSGRPAAASNAAAAVLHSETRVLNVEPDARASLMPEKASSILNGGFEVPARASAGN